MADLNRNKFVQSNLQYNPEAHYRAIGQGGYQDWLQSKIIRPNPMSKQAYQDAYFMKGGLLDRYAGPTREAGSYIVESTSPNIKQLPNGYYGAQQLTKNDPYKIWSRSPEGTYNLVHENIPQTTLQKLGGVLGKVGVGIGSALAIGSTAEGLQNIKNRGGGWITPAKPEIPTGYQ